MFNPRVRKIPWRRNWQSTPVLLPADSRVVARLPLRVMVFRGGAVKRGHQHGADLTGSPLSLHEQSREHTAQRLRGLRRKDTCQHLRPGLRSPGVRRFCCLSHVGCRTCSLAAQDEQDEGPHFSTERSEV